MNQSTKQIGLLHRLTDKGFGFLRPCALTWDGRWQVIPARDRSSDCFVHVRDAMASGIYELELGAVYEYGTDIDKKSGKSKAVNLKRVENEQPAN